MEDYKKYILNYVDENHPKRDIIFDALDFAVKIHDGQLRKSNEPYIIHPLTVVQILAQDLKIKDPYLLASALLHDVVEDAKDVKIHTIEKRFGKLIAEIVDGCTKMNMQRLDQTTLKDLTHSKIFLSSSKRFGVLLIKLADRLHNIRTLKFHKKAKQRLIAQETIEVYAPMAATLNFFYLKRNLYQEALPYLYPKKSKKIIKYTRELRNSPEVVEIQKKLEQALFNFPHPFSINPRIRSLGSYYSPTKKTLEINNAENHVDFKIVLKTDDIFSCYNVLGIVSNLFVSVPKCIRDYIALPRSNGYQSLHIRINVNGKEFLIKIRTEQMEMDIQKGILSRWNITELMSNKCWKETSELFRNLGEYNGSAPQRKDLISRLGDLKDTHVFTPKRDIHYLPQGSILLDFAYKIHTDFGNLCKGGRVNGKWENLTSILQDGDVAEVVASQTPLDADTDLEKLCKTPKARSAVNKQLRTKRRLYAKEIGKEILFQEINRMGLPVTCLESDIIRLFLEFKNIKDLSQLYTLIGQDSLSPTEIMYYFDNMETTKTSLFIPKSRLGDISWPRYKILISSLDKGIHKFSNCCKPHPGQDNVVAALSERGVSFHRKKCLDLSTRHKVRNEKLIAVEWDFTSLWKKAMKFNVKIMGKTIYQILPLVKRAPSSIIFHSINSSTNNGPQKFSRISLSLNNFSESRSFFQCFENESLTIEQYGRYIE